MTFARSMVLLSIFATLVGLTIPLVRAENELTAEQFDRLRALIKPHSGEDKWSEIPWASQLWEARNQAAALGKPILLWEMDGNPLGCG